MEELGVCSICGQEHPIAGMVTAHQRPEEIPEDALGGFPAPRDWWLADGEAKHAEHPRSFLIPDRGRRESLRPGELIKLEFTYGPHADAEGEGHVERMWVEVLDARHGRLRNQPKRLTELNLGDHVHFEPEHVITIDYSDDELGYPQSEWLVVDQRILDEDRAPAVVLRAHGVWWLLCPEPTQPVQETPNWLSELFPGLLEPLRAGEGQWVLAEGERETARYRRVETDPELVASLAPRDG